MDYRVVSPQTICGSSVPKKDFDFMYVCLPGRWTEMTKNWALAKACLYRLCNDLGLKGLLLGRWQILDLPFVATSRSWATYLDGSRSSSSVARACCLFPA